MPLGAFRWRKSTILKIGESGNFILRYLNATYIVLFSLYYFANVRKLEINATNIRCLNFLWLLKQKTKNREARIFGI